MYAAIIEWPAEAIEAPDLITAGTVGDTFWPLIQSLSFISDESYEDDKDFIKDHPYPTDGNDTAALASWLWAMRNATTTPWVEFYDISTPGPAVKLSITEVLGAHTNTQEL
jgi:hypothetical protein